MMNKVGISELKFSLSFISVILTLIFGLPASSNAQKPLKAFNFNLKMNPRDVIINAFELAKQKKSYILESISLNETDEVDYGRIIYRFSLPDYQIEMHNSKEQILMEQISIGKDFYSKLLSDKWEKSKKVPSQNTAEILDKYAEKSKLIKNSEFVGEEQIDGKKAYLYQYDFDLNVIVSEVFSPLSKDLPNNKIRIWIDSGGLPMKIEYKGILNWVKVRRILKKIEKFEFDENIKIEAPKI